MHPKQLQANVEQVKQPGGPEITVTMCFELVGHQGDGLPIWKDKLSNQLYVLTPYTGSEKRRKDE